MAGEQDKELKVGDNKHQLEEGDLVCKGAWLKKLKGKRIWVTMMVHNRETIVSMRNVGTANLKLRVRSEQNPLQRGADKNMLKLQMSMNRGM